MGRTKYSPEARNAIMAAFVKATKEIVDDEGIDAASIRRVSMTAGYSSATLYLYFEDMNELITMSLISHLSEYTAAIVSSTPEDAESAEDAYLRSWKLFCEHAFANPATFLHLFYGPQSHNLDQIAKKYYELFPEDLGNASGQMLEMLGRGDLGKRNLVLLESFASDLGLSEHETELANNLTLAYFHSFLEEATKTNLSHDQIEDFTDRFIEGALFVLRGHSGQ